MKTRFSMIWRAMILTAWIFISMSASEATDFQAVQETVIPARSPSGNIGILRDRYGVPHIQAGNEADALFGLGYVHAQDRLWQMEYQRRLGAGRLSEVLGESTLATDKLFRTLGLKSAAEGVWAQYEDRDRQLLQAYVAGINAFLSNRYGRRLLPPNSKFSVFSQNRGDRKTS